MPTAGGGRSGGGDSVVTGQTPSRGRVLVPALLAIGALLLGWIIFAGIYSDWLWYSSVGQTQAFRVRVLTQIGMLLVFGGVMFAALVVTPWIAYRTRPELTGLTAEQASLERYRMSLQPYRKWVVVVIAGMFALMTGLSAAAEWDVFKLWRNRQSFGTTDPQFGMDVGFYVFTLPWLRFLVGFFFAVAVLCLIAAVTVHYLYGGIRLQGEGPRLTRAAAVHISVLGALVMLLKAAAYWLDRYELTTQSKSLVLGFTGLSYTDVNAVLPSRNILAFAALVVAALFIVAAFRGSLRLPLLGVVLLLITSLLIGWVYPAFVQYFQVRPTELERESPFIERNIQATLQAYDLADVQRQEYAGNEVASVDALRNEAGTLQATRLLDPAVVSPTFRQLQQIRGFYAFPDTLDVDRYAVEGGTRGMITSVREIDLQGLPVGQRNWTNDTTVFTHGFGFVSAYDNTAQANGQPEFSESDIPSVGVLDIEQPRVYFGESSPPYSIVGAPEGAAPQEFDFPDDASPNGQRNNTYTGSGGASVGSFFNKLVFATTFQDSNILLSDRVNPNSRILWDRDPRVRVEKVAPWLSLDGDPYPVVAGGRIVWMIDGYTTSNQYPNAARTSLLDATSDSITTRTGDQISAARERINYMRNSVKATVDAYDGTVTLYAWDAQDPVLRSWRASFPGLVQDVGEMPDELLAHVRYPEDMFKVQRTIFSRYHVQDPSAFYSGQDFWIVPLDPTQPTQEALQPPYYLTLQMPGQEAPTFSLTTAFSPSRRQTLASFMAVNSDPGPDYGTIRVLQLPRNTTIPGPTQVQNNFESDPVVAQQLSLLRRGGSEVVLGNLLSLPIAGGMLYVEPVYVQAAGEQGFPLLRKVLVGYGPKVAMEDTLTAALQRVFVGAGTTPPGDGTTDPVPTDPQQRLTRALLDAQQAFQDGEAALARGDFAAYGEAQARLQVALQEAAAAQAALTGDPSVQVPPQEQGDGTEGGTDGGAGAGQDAAGPLGSVLLAASTRR
jgi:uncharacterized membrane protein (UPF0182 family)